MKSYPILFLFLPLLLGACRQSAPDIEVSVWSSSTSPLTENYDGVVVPPNIAPLTFYMDDGEGVILSTENCHLSAIAQNGAAIPELETWRTLLADAVGQDIRVVHCRKSGEEWEAYQPFALHVATEPIDSFLTYRLIPPGYEKWFDMSIRQRNLTNFEETVIAANSESGRNCMNCHAFCAQDANRMTMHLRGKNGGTVIARDGQVRHFDPRQLTGGTNFVYPYWHPSGRYIAYSTNDTKQLFHTHNPNRIEVMDLKSDVVVYDCQTEQVLKGPELADSLYFETFPCFSPDGKWLWFCRAPRPEQMPDDYKQVRYSLCRMAFDPSSGTFTGGVETVIDADRAGYSVSVPRISPDGKHLLYTYSQYGQFLIWHQDADLGMLDLDTADAAASGTGRPLTAVNSSDADSYHTWSSNSRWIVFSSRRDDGLYTRPYIAYIAADGTASKPFCLPQSTGDYYDALMYSYNVPELTRNAVRYKVLTTVSAE